MFTPAYIALVSYMIRHNYTLKDYDIYSQDPEWVALNHAVCDELMDTECSKDAA